MAAVPRTPMKPCALRRNCHRHGKPDRYGVGLGGIRKYIPDVGPVPSGRFH